MADDFVVGKIEFATTTAARPQTFQVTVPSTVAKSEPSVPLSAIRALVQQWRMKEIVAGQCSVEFSQEAAEIAGKEAETLARCIKELAALCPAPPEET